jgi:hypothetical protein
MEESINGPAKSFDSTKTQNPFQNSKKNKANNKSNVQPRAGMDAIPNVDAFQRMNFLLQASYVVQASGNTQLSTFYNYTLQKIASRNVLRV